MVFAPVAAAQEGAAETTPSGEKIEQIRQEIQKKVEEKLNNVLNQIKKRAWIGTIEEKSATAIKLLTLKEVRTVNLAEDVKIINLKRKEISVDDLEKGQRIVAMGFVQTDGTMEGKRLVLLPSYKERKTKVIFGTITDKSSEEKIISITGSEEKYEVIISDKTGLRERKNSKISNITYEAVKVNQKVIAIITPTESNGSTYQAKTILVLTALPKPSAAPTEKADEKDE